MRQAHDEQVTVLRPKRRIHAPDATVPGVTRRIRAPEATIPRKTRTSLSMFPPSPFFLFLPKVFPEGFPQRLAERMVQ